MRESDRLCHKKDVALTPEERSASSGTVALAELLCRRLSLQDSLILAGDLRLRLDEHPEPQEASRISELLEGLRNSIQHETMKRLYLAVTPELAKYYEQEKLFGDKVHDAFANARQDIREAGTCLACDNHTAAVFHLMRVAEYGLRALAYDRRIHIPKNTPLDLATWEEIIRELEQAEKEIQGYPKTLAREAQFDFYHGAGMEFKRFKNKFRNRVMHTRESYDEHQAKSAMDHVKAFMEILSSRISEHKRTPKIWKGKKWLSQSKA